MKNRAYFLEKKNLFLKSSAESTIATTCSMYMKKIGLVFYKIPKGIILFIPNCIVVTLPISLEIIGESPGLLAKAKHRKRKNWRYQLEEKDYLGVKKFSEILFLKNLEHSLGEIEIKDHVVSVEEAKKNHIVICYF